MKLITRNIKKVESFLSIFTLTPKVESFLPTQKSGIAQKSAYDENKLARMLWKLLKCRGPDNPIIGWEV